MAEWGLTAAIVVSVASIAIAMIAFGRSWGNGHRALKDTVDTLSKQYRELATDRDDLRARLTAMENEMARIMTGVRILVNQLIDHDIEPEWLPEPARVIPTMTRARLGKMIGDSFSMSEIDELTLEVLGIEPAEIVGTTPSAKARSLVTAAGGRGKLADLTRKVAELRPHLFEN